MTSAHRAPYRCLPSHRPHPRLTPLLHLELTSLLWWTRSSCPHTMASASPASTEASTATKPPDASWSASLTSSSQPKSFELEDDEKDGFFLFCGFGALMKSPYVLPDRGYGLASRKTKIIIAGGLILQPVFQTNLKSVFQYDTSSDEWSELPPMKYDRAEYPTVALVEDMIFIFGFMYPTHYDSDEDIKLCGEYCRDLNFPE